MAASQYAHCKTKQGPNLAIYSFFLRGSDILELADLTRLRRDENGKLRGFQRKEIQRHVKSIVEYLDRGSVLFPNAIILAFSPKDIEFKQSRGPTPKGTLDISSIGTLNIPKMSNSGRRAAWVVDGQQRSLALSKTTNKSIVVPAVGFVAGDLEIQRETVHPSE